MTSTAPPWLPRESRISSAAAALAQPDAQSHRAWAAVAAAAWTWAVLFPVLALANQTHLFADGGMFSLAVAAGESWPWHWANMSGRIAVYFLAVVPAERIGALFASPHAALATYALLFNLAPLASLALVHAARCPPAIRRACHLSSVMLLPFLFAFPSEIWVAHSAIWPALAFAAAPAPARQLPAIPLILVTALSHEAGVLWLLGLAVLLAVVPPTSGRTRLVIPLAGIVVALLAWAAIRATWRPDAYTAEILARNAGVFLDPGRLLSPLLLLQLAAIAVYLPVARTRAARPAIALAAAIALPAATAILTLLPPHAWDRYYLRTLAFLATPAFLAAALAAPRLPALVGLARRAVPPHALAGMLLLLTTCHAAQTLGFLAGWSAYRDQVIQLSHAPTPALAPGSAPALADPADPLHRAYGWNSTTPFLAILLDPALAPPRLVVDPTSSYFWFSCAIAGRTRAALLPPHTRAALTNYACTHRAE